MRAPGGGEGGAPAPGKEPAVHRDFGPGPGIDGRRLYEEVYSEQMGSKTSRLSRYLAGEEVWLSFSADGRSASLLARTSPMEDAGFRLSSPHSHPGGLRRGVPAGPGRRRASSVQALGQGILRTYAFLSSILPYNNARWEERSIFLNFLVSKLPSPREEDMSKGILDAIDMDSYRVREEGDAEDPPTG